MSHVLRLRVTGFILSLILTLTAYGFIVYPEFLNLDVRTAALIVFALALIQSLVQLIFFISVWKEDGPPWNLTVFISTVSIIFIIIFFSIWIITHLNYNMR